jgi:thioredoxin-related protein
MINKIFSVFLISITAISMAQAQNRADMFDWKPLAEAMELAEQNNKKVLVYANAVWCIYCKKVEKEVFTLESVQQKTKEHFYPVWIDIESDEKLTFRGEEMTQIQFSRLMRITGTPTFIFFDSEGEIITAQPGFIPEEMYLQILEFVGSDAYLDQSFGEFAGIEAEN